MIRWSTQRIITPLGRLLINIFLNSFDVKKNIAIFAKFFRRFKDAESE